MRKPPMAKCANQDCQVRFRYFHEGRLFYFEIADTARTEELARRLKMQLEVVWQENGLTGTELEDRRRDVETDYAAKIAAGEQQARCARKRMLDRLDSWHLESNTPFEIDFRIGLAAYSRGADADRVLKLAEERLQSGRLPATADQPSCDLTSCAPQPANGGFRREL